MSWLRAIAVDIATTSRLKSDSSMPARPWVMPSHIAGTPPAIWATPPACSTAFLRIDGVALERLVGREHVVVGRHDRDVAPLGGPQVELLVGAARGQAVGQVRAPQIAARGAFCGGRTDAFEVGGTGAGAARGDPRGDFA